MSEVSNTSATLLGLIGSPIKSSASPAMHEAAAQRAGMRCFYHLIDVANADAGTLRRMLDGVRLLGFYGVNVTYPYKEAVLPLLDQVAPAASAIGAVNTVVVSGGKLIGHNTDATGFGRACREAIGPATKRPVALIGAGGVGKAIAFALADLGVPALRIFERDRAKAVALAEALSSKLLVEICGTVAEAVEGACGLVNGTPVGMLPSRDSPVPYDLLRRDMWVADAVYTPLWTPLLEAARAGGAKIMTGRELAIFQAMDAFELFTGVEPSRDAMGAAFDAVMERRAAQPQAA